MFAAFSVPSRLMTNYGVLLGPQGFSLVSFAAVFRNPNIWSGYRNTLIIVVGGTALNMLMTILGGYVLSRKGWFLTRPIALGVVFTMYFSGGLIPFYLTVRGLGLTDTLLALIIPTAINTYNMMIMRTAMVTIPASLEESAKLDGAGHLTILFRIIAPLIFPTLAVLLLYYGVEHWNAWFNAMIFLRKRSLFPLQLILREILIQNVHVRHVDRLSHDRPGNGERDHQVLGDHRLHRAHPVPLSLPAALLREGRDGGSRQGLKHSAGACHEFPMATRIHDPTHVD